MSSRLRASLCAAVAAAVMATSGAVLAQSPVTQSADDARMEALVRRYIENNPEVILESINRYVAREQAKAKTEEDDIIAKFAADLADPKDQPILGNPDGKVTLVYVLDAACTYCRQMSPVIQQILQENKDVRIIQRWVPFLSPSSEYAARVATLVWKRHGARYHQFYSALMSEKAPLTHEMVDGAVSRVLGEDATAPIKAEIAVGNESESIAQTVYLNMELAQRSQIKATPFIYVPGVGSEGIIRGAVPASQLQAAVNRARDAVKQ